MKTKLFTLFLFPFGFCFSQVSFGESQSVQYDSIFLAGLEEMFPETPVLLTGDLLIIFGDTLAFPEKPAFGQLQVYTARQGDLAVALTLERISYTSVDYRLEMVEFNNTAFERKGTAKISPGFVLGSEVDVNEEGEGYMVSEYMAEPSEGCFVSIRISNYEDMETRVKVTSNCNGELGELTLDNFPALHEK